MIACVSVVAQHGDVGCTLRLQYVLHLVILFVVQVKTMFTTIVDSGTAAFHSIRSAVTVALAAHLLYGKAALAADATAAASCNALLGRVGAAALYDDVADLGEKVAGVAAVNEAVHGHLLAALTTNN